MPKWGRNQNLEFFTVPFGATNGSNASRRAHGPSGIRPDSFPCTRTQGGFQNEHGPDAFGADAEL